LARRDDLFAVDGLIAPPPSAALAELFAVLLRLERHPLAKELGHLKQRQIWELHRVLYHEPDVVMLTEHYLEEDIIPLPCEIAPLAQACWRLWSDLARLGMRVDREDEPVLPMPARRRGRRHVFPPDDDD
jgi:hypothetical protein